VPARLCGRKRVERSSYTARYPRSPAPAAVGPWPARPAPPPRRPARPGWRRGKDGFYEWKKLNGRKQPDYIRLQDGRPFAFAGLWEHWNRGDSPIDSCTILTTDANELVGSIHDRMPVIVDPGDYDLWLDTEVQDVKRLEPLLVPYTSEAMAAWPVSTRVNNPKADDPKCIEPAG
jgi:putative SOS response-associated peptidase YedK